MFDEIRTTERQKLNPALFWPNLAAVIGSVIAMFAFPEYPRVAWTARFAGIFFAALLFGMLYNRHRNGVPSIKDSE